MSQISDEKLMEHIADGIEELTPDHAEELWNRPVDSADGSEWYLDSAKKKRSRPSMGYWAGAAAACLVLCIVTTFLFQVMPSASVYLDVNPSITLQVNNRDRVTKAIPCNEDAVEILGDMDFRGTNLDVALYAILGSMVHHGYLTEAKDTILVSVHSANAGRANELEIEAADIVSQSLKKMLHTGEVLSQQVDKDKISREGPAENCTPGKKVFVQDMIDRYPQLEQENLDDLTIDEIVSILTEEKLDYSDYKDKDDDDDDDKDEDDDDQDDDDHDDDEDDKDDDHDDEEDEKDDDDKEDDDND